MKKLSKCEMIKVSGGGLNITVTFLTALIRGVNSFMDVGRSLGTAIRRTTSGKYCPL